MPNATGISKAGNVDIIRNKVARMDERKIGHTLYGTLKVSLKIHLFYDITDNKIIGLEEFWTRHQNQQSSHFRDGLSCAEYVLNLLK